MTLIHSFTEFYTLPMKSASTIVSKNENSHFESIKARLLFVAQLIVSKIAIPIFLISLVFGAICGEKGEETVDECCNSLKDLFTKVIPISIIGIFAPFSTIDKCVKSFEDSPCCGERNSNRYIDDQSKEILELSQKNFSC